MTKQLNQEKIDTPPRDAATVILIRDAGSDLEVLLLRRGNSQTVMNNAWVFPGGKLDKEDYDKVPATAEKLRLNASVMLAEPALNADHACALFHAACRETQEETGVIITVEQLYPWSRWITPNTPAMMKKRFDARFFIARMPAGQTVVHDGVEATDSAWLTARQALDDYQTHKITLAPPQIMTLVALCRQKNTDTCIEFATSHSPYCVQPKVFTDSQNRRTMTYPGDTDHPVAEKNMPGPTRLIWQGEHFEPADGFDKYFA